MIERNKLDAFNGIQQLRKYVFEPIVDKFQGRIFKFTGVGVFAEFTNVVNAVRCSIEIQSAVSSQNEKLPTTEWVDLHIGVSLGEVLVEGDEHFGNAVDIAARLGNLAEPETNCGAPKVHEHIGVTLDLVYKDQHDQTVNNNNKPISTLLTRPTGLLASRQKKSVVLNSPPSLVILPFQNLIFDPEKEYFADRITDELIDTVSQLKKLRVISRNSSFVYKGRSVDVRQVASNLSARYVLEGSVRLDGDKLRITGQLIEGNGGTLIWADRYDGELEDGYALQHRIAGAVVSAIESTIRTTEIKRARRTQTGGHQPLRVH